MMDNYDLWEQHEAEQHAQLEKCPKCTHCGKKIQDEYMYDIDGGICEECLEEDFKVSTDKFME